jgi:hypothetical protein
MGRLFMSRFNVVVIVLAFGAVLGTVLRPGLLEVAIVTAAICGIAAVYRSAGRRSSQPT